MPRIEVKARWIADDGSAWESDVSSVNVDRITWANPLARERIMQIITDVLDDACRLEGGKPTSMAVKVADRTF
jgi:hypothetical protein